MDKKIIESADKIEESIFGVLINYIENEKDVDLDDEFYIEAKKNYNLIKNEIPKLDQQIKDIWKYELKIDVSEKHFKILSADNKDVKLIKKKMWAKQIELEIIKENILVWIVKNRILL